MRNILKNIEEKHMGFVLEDVSDEDRKRYNISDYYTSCYKDKDRDILILEAIYPTRVHDTFTIYFNDSCSKIGTICESGGNKKIGVFVKYYITNIRVDNLIKNQKSKVVKILKELLKYDFEDSYPIENKKLEIIEGNPKGLK